MACHGNLIAAFTMFLMNDGYEYEVSKNTINFSKPTKDQVKINNKGEMNKAGSDRYTVFLKIWLQRGKSFIDGLTDQFRLCMGINL